MHPRKMSYEIMHYSKFYMKQCVQQSIGLNSGNHYVTEKNVVITYMQHLKLHPFMQTKYTPMKITKRWDHQINRNKQNQVRVHETGQQSHTTRTTRLLKEEQYKYFSRNLKTSAIYRADVQLKSPEVTRVVSSFPVSLSLFLCPTNALHTPTAHASENSLPSHFYTYFGP